MAERYDHSRAEQCEGQLFVYEVQMRIVVYTTNLSDTQKKTPAAGS